MPNFFYEDLLAKSQRHVLEKHFKNKNARTKKYFPVSLIYLFLILKIDMWKYMLKL